MLSLHNRSMHTHLYTHLQTESLNSLQVHALHRHNVYEQYAKAWHIYMIWSNVWENKYMSIASHEIRLLSYTVYMD